MQIEHDMTETQQLRSGTGHKAGYMAAAVSGVLLIALFMACLLLPEERIYAAAKWVTSAKGLAVPALLSAISAVIYIVIFLIYRLVESFMNRESSLRLYIDRIIKFVGGMCGDFLFHILQFVRFAPDFLGWGHQLLSEEDESTEGDVHTLEKQTREIQTREIQTQDIQTQVIQTQDIKIHDSQGQKQTVKRGREFWNFINICAVFLAAISLYTTAEGMSRFFFHNSKGQAWLISLAVQGILLALNLRLPAYLIGKAGPAKACAIGLYAFTILWSAGFSYIFMANVVYEDTWMKDAQIEISGVYQQTRQELAGRAQETMELAVGDVLADVTALQAAAEGGSAEVSSAEVSSAGISRIDGNMDSLRPDDSIAASRLKEGDMYVAGENAAGGENAAARENAAPGEYATVRWERYQSLFAEDARMLHVIELLDDSRRSAQDTRSAIETLEDRKASLAAQLEELEQKKTDTRTLYTQLDNERTQLIDKRAKVPADSEAHASYTQAMEEKSGSMEEARSALQAYETREQNVLDRQDAVEAMLAAGELVQDSVPGKISEDFTAILSQIGSTEPDMDEISRRADQIYTSLITSAKAGEDTQVYGNILEIYLKLGNDLNQAADIREVLKWAEDRSDVAEKTELLVMSDGGEQNGVKGVPVSESDTKTWRVLWNKALGELKEKLLLVPDEKGMSQLLNRIDRLQRNYLLELNEVEKAGNYLFGTYPAMAWFSLFFALYLDSAPMLLAVFKYCSVSRTKGIIPKAGAKHTGLSKVVLGAGCMLAMLLPAALLLLYRG